MTQTIRIGTRRSRLALWQTDYVMSLLQLAWPEVNVERQIIVTQGDQILDKPLHAVGGKGLFTAELDRSLREQSTDLAVHSLKDLPTEPDDEIGVLAIPPRHDPHDVLITRHNCLLDELPLGATIGTSSRRRAAQLLYYRPDLNIIDIRGNVDTRIAKAFGSDGIYDAIILAQAGVERLELSEHISQILPFEIMLPAPGQGAIAVQGLIGGLVQSKLDVIHDYHTALAVVAERAFLAALGGGCSLPVAAYGQVVDGMLILRARVIADDGGRMIEVREQIDLAGDNTHQEQSARQLGERCAQLAIQQGAADIIAAISNVQLDSPLNGKKVVITRARHQSNELVKLLQQRGAQPLLYPCIDIAPPDDLVPFDTALQQLDQYDWLLLTSRNTVLMLESRLQALGIAKDLLTTIKVGAVGPATAQLFKHRFNRDVDLVPDVHTGKGLAEALVGDAKQRFLLPQSAIARDALETTLRSADAEVNVVTAYQTVIGTGGVQLAELLASGEVDAVLFTSPSTIENCMVRLQQESGDVDVLKQLPGAAMGTTTHQAAQNNNFSAMQLPEDISLAGMIDALEAYFADDTG